MWARDQIFGLGRFVCSDGETDIGPPPGRLLQKVDMVVGVSPGGLPYGGGTGPPDPWGTPGSAPAMPRPGDAKHRL